MFKMLKQYLHFLDNQYLKGRIFLLKNAENIKKYKQLLSLYQKPIIIGGAARSGTSLLLSILSAHPNIHAIADETNAFCPTAYSSSVNLNAPFETHKMLLNLVLHYSGDPKITRWVEKTPKNILYAERIMEYLGPKARFIHIVRDGRDVVTSVHPENPYQYWVTPERWVSDVKYGIKAEKHHQVITIRYEDLIKHYKQTVGQIMDFIEEDFHPDLMRYPQTARIKTHRAWILKNATELKDTSNNRWRNSKHSQIIKRLYAIPEAIYVLKYYGYLV